jgi:hypothetical protein
MHSCPSEPSLPAVAPTHLRCHPAARLEPVSRVQPSLPLASQFTWSHAPLVVDSRSGLLLPRSPSRVRVAGASRPPGPASGRRSACTLRRLEPVGCASPRRCRVTSTSGYFRRQRTGLPRPRSSEDVRACWLPVCSLGLCSCVVGTVRLIRRCHSCTAVARRVLTRGRWSLSPGPPTLGLRLPREGVACSAWGVWLRLTVRCPKAASCADSNGFQVTGLELPAPSPVPLGPRSGAPLGGASAPQV